METESDSITEHNLRMIDIILSSEDMPYSCLIGAGNKDTTDFLDKTRWIDTDNSNYIHTFHITHPNQFEHFDSTLGSKPVLYMNLNDPTAFVLLNEFFNCRLRKITFDYSTTKSIYNSTIIKLFSLLIDGGNIIYSDPGAITVTMNYLNFKKSITDEDHRSIIIQYLKKKFQYYLSDLNFILTEDKKKLDYYIPKRFEHSIPYFVITRNIECENKGISQAIINSIIDTVDRDEKEEALQMKELLKRLDKKKTEEYLQMITNLGMTEDDVSEQIKLFEEYFSMTTVDRRSSYDDRSGIDSGAGGAGGPRATSASIDADSNILKLETELNNIDMIINEIIKEHRFPIDTKLDLNEKITRIKIYTSDYNKRLDELLKQYTAISEELYVLFEEKYKKKYLKYKKKYLKLRNKYHN
jgi:hypothetical protein